MTFSQRFRTFFQKFKPIIPWVYKAVGSNLELGATLDPVLSDKANMKAKTLIWLGGYLSPSEMLRDVRNSQPGRPENYRHAVHIICRCFFIGHPLCTYTILSKSWCLFPRTSVLIFGQIKPLLAMVITVACLWLSITVIPTCCATNPCGNSSGHLESNSKIQSES
jgi:hypothetical protein